MSAEKEVRAAAYALLARRDHSLAELKRRLLARGHDPAAVGGVLAALVEEGVLNEDRLAESVVRRGLRRGRGPRRLEAELLARGLEAACARKRIAALCEEGVDWLQRAKEAVRRLKRRPGETKEAFRARIARRLERQGFPSSVIARVIELEPAEPGED